MIKQLSYAFLVAFLAVSGFGSAAQSTSTSHLQWHENFNEAAQLSASTGKPMFVLFTGSDWCTWCIKLENESLATSEFAQQLGDKLIFVKLDFPARGVVPAPIKQINDSIKNKYGIKSFPTVLLLDSQQRQIGATGYKEGGGASYAEHIQKMLSGYSAYQNKVHTMENTKISQR